MKKIGNTPMLKSKKLHQSLGIGSLYFKLEGFNPTGSHKDRIAFEWVKETLLMNGITAGSCGNYAASIAWFADQAHIYSMLFIPEFYLSIASQKAFGSKYSQIVSVKGTYEDAVAASCQFAKENNFLNANPIEQNEQVFITAFKQIYFEIHSQLGSHPEVIFLPVGNGTTCAGIMTAIRELSLKTKVVLVGSKGNNSLIASLKHGQLVKLDPTSLKETPFNAPLVNWNSLNSLAVMKIFNHDRDSFFEATDDELCQACDMILSAEGIHTTPSSAASLVGLTQLSRQVIIESAVVLLTS